MDTIIVNDRIKLIPYFENYDTTLKWYEDKDAVSYTHLTLPTKA